MAKATKATAVAAPVAQVGGVPRGVVYTGGVGGNQVLVSTHRRQYVVMQGGKALGYFTASQAAGHQNAINRFMVGVGNVGGPKLKPCKPAHLQRLPGTGKLVAGKQ